jgi:YggT family protein
MPVAHALIAAFLEVIYSILSIYIWCLIVGAVLSWLVAFNVVNPYNRAVRVVGDFITRITEPVLQHVRRVIPVMGGLDLSPMALIFIIYFIQSFIRHLTF